MQGRNLTLRGEYEAGPLLSMLNAAGLVRWRRVAALIGLND